MKKLLFILVIPVLFAFENDVPYVNVARKYVSMDGHATLELKRGGKAVEIFHAIHQLRFTGKWNSDGEILTIDFKDTLYHNDLEFYDIFPDTLKQHGEAVFVREKK